MSLSTDSNDNGKSNTAARKNSRKRRNDVIMHKFDDDDDDIPTKIRKIFGDNVADNLSRSEIRRLRVANKKQDGGLTADSPILEEIMKRNKKLRKVVNQIVDKKLSKIANDLVDDNTPDDSLNDDSSLQVASPTNEQDGDCETVEKKTRGSKVYYIHKKGKHGIKTHEVVVLGDEDTDDSDEEQPNEDDINFIVNDGDDDENDEGDFDETPMQYEGDDDDGDEGDEYLDDDLQSSLPSSLPSPPEKENDERKNNYDIDDGVNGIELIRDANDLIGDNLSHEIQSDRLLTRGQKARMQEQIFEIQSTIRKNSLQLKDVLIEQFNAEDTAWLYKNISRLDRVSGVDRIDMEDKIDNRYNYLKLLKRNDLYENNISTTVDITQQILNSNKPMHIKRTLLQKINNVTKDSIEEYQKAEQWVNTILRLPTETKSDRSEANIKEVLGKLHKGLCENMTGMQHVISHIIQAVCTIMRDPDNRGYILALLGPPGVGKTTICSQISESTGMGFSHISCGTLNDVATIMGHGSTYIGATPGIITQAILRTGQLDNVILLDELDQLHNAQLFPAFLHVLDKTQNDKFKDAYCPEIDIDLSKNFFVVAVNNLNNLSAALRDRLKVVNISGYTAPTKYSICINHVIPKAIKKTNVNITLCDEIVKDCINVVSPEDSGIRDLDRFFSDVYERLALIKCVGPEKGFEICGLKYNDITSRKKSLQRLLDIDDIVEFKNTKEDRQLLHDVIIGMYNGQPIAQKFDILLA